MPPRLLLALLLLILLGVLSAESEASLGKADHVIVEKAARKLTLYRDGVALKSYHVALGFSPKGPKERQGDGRTPEGRYVIDRRNAQSQFHLSLHISYPDAQDRARAAEAGFDPGGDIFIHGLPNGLGHLGAAFNLRDWTLGCIAVTDPEIEEVWAAVPNGTPIEIKP
jgi:murein L,D-transpeptidase YafK